MAEIRLTNGGITIVDEADYHWVNQYNWNAAKKRLGKIYVQRCIYGVGSIILAREILKAPSHLFVDHINGDSLDNRRENLRLATRQQNAANCKMHSSNTTGYRGIFERKGKATPWGSRINIGGKTFHLGSYMTKVEAAKRYDLEAFKCFGVFASLNFPEDFV